MPHKDIAPLLPTPPARKHATQATIPHTAANFHNESKIMKYINSSILGPKTLYCYIIKTLRKPRRRSNRIKGRKGKITRRENIRSMDEWVDGRYSVCLCTEMKGKWCKLTEKAERKKEIKSKPLTVPRIYGPVRDLKFSQQCCRRLKSSWTYVAASGKQLPAYQGITIHLPSDETLVPERWSHYYPSEKTARCHTAEFSIKRFDI